MQKNRNTKNLAWLLVIPLIIGVYSLAINFSGSQNNNSASRIMKKGSSQKKVQKTDTENISLGNENVIKAKKKSLKSSAANQDTSSKLNSSDPKKTLSAESDKKTTSQPKNKPDKTLQSKPANLVKVTLIINKGQGSKSYSVQIAPASTVLALLRKASSQYGFSLKYSNYSYGAFVEELDGLRTNESRSMYWLYYINGKLANLGASAQKVKKGDSITWKYEKTN